MFEQYLERQNALIGDNIKAGLERVFSHSRYIQGPEVFELETALCKYSKVEHCISCSSGTDALLMSLMAIDTCPGDLVFVPAFSFISTVEVVLLLGATPVFVDIDESLTMCPEHLKKLVHKFSGHSHYRIKAVIPVDIFGCPCDYDAINKIASESGMIVIADAAQSFGATYKNTRVGSLASITCTSFFPTKPLGCYGDGGAIFLTPRSYLAYKLNSIREHGRGIENKYDNFRVGINGRLDTIQSAVLLTKLTILDGEIESRRRIARIFDDTFAPYVQLQKIPSEVKSSYAQYAILTPLRNQLQSYLKTCNISSTVIYPKPLYKQQATTGRCEVDTIPYYTDKVCKQVLCFGIHPYITDPELEYFTKRITDFFNLT